MTQVIKTSLFCLLFLLGCGDGGAPSTPAKFITIGDSLAQGSTATWVAQVADEIDREIVNLAIPGFTAFGWSPDLEDGTWLGVVEEAVPDFRLVVMVGVIDAFLRVNSRDFRNRLDDIIVAAFDLGAGAIYLMQIPDYIGSQRIDEFRAAKESLCSFYEAVACVPVELGREGTVDGIHFNEHGNGVVANMMMGRLRASRLDGPSIYTLRGWNWDDAARARRDSGTRVGGRRSIPGGIVPFF